MARTSSLRVRYELTPQMKTYDLMRQFVVPYISQANQPEMKSTEVSTDEFGTRRTVTKNGLVDRCNYKRGGIIFVGGSVAFGWGATSDNSTIPSIVSRKVSVPCLNLGLMAGNSEMETISCLPYADSKDDYFVSITGLNTLCNELSLCFSKQPIWKGLYGPMMPFNEAYWKNVISNDILINRSFISGDFDPKGAFKEREDRKRFRRAHLTRYLRKITTMLRLGNGFDCDSTYEVSDESLKVAVQNAVQTQIRCMTNMAALTHNQIIFAIQPFIYAGDRIMSEEENILCKEHFKFSSPQARKLIYELMPTVYTKFAQGVLDKAEELGLSTIDLTNLPSRKWHFSDTVHLTDEGNEHAAEVIAKALFNDFKCRKKFNMARGT